eukprot:TRINITY_DN115220_c0_g1_i1.p1 TRINITY_DN115220_c0_g1~~TRINITY_DN115220_c0_g1_i1.p1  ORF type:complete len:250 (+),score=36.65 TRINITY_DN115220_c0_g1_i1:68-817(+)
MCAALVAGAAASCRARPARAAAAAVACRSAVVRITGCRDFDAAAAAFSWRREGGRRCFNVMKNSWPSGHRPPSTPNSPSIAKIVRQMERTRTQQDRDEAEAEAGFDPQRHIQRLPDGYLPRGAGTPAAASNPMRRVGVAENTFSKGGAQPGSDLPGGVAGKEWRPPGWDAYKDGAHSEAFEKQFGSRVPKSKRKKTLQAERPEAEVWGVRIMVLTILTIAGMHARDYYYTNTQAGKLKRLPRIKGLDED